MDVIDYIQVKLQEYKLFFDKVISFIISLSYGSLILLLNFLSLIKHGKDFFFVANRRPLAESISDRSLGHSCFVQLHNIKLHYMKKGKEENQLILFVHGFPEFWYSWHNYYLDLSSYYYTVSVDLRGFGESERSPHLENYKIKDMCKDLKYLIEYLGKNSAIIIANDIGATIASVLAKEYPSCVEQLILINGFYINSFYEYTLFSWKQFFKSWYIYFFQIPVLPEFNLAAKDLLFFNNVFSDFKTKTRICSQEQIEAYKCAFAQIGALTCALNVYRANFFDIGNIENSEKIIAPTLLIYGCMNRFIDQASLEISIKHYDDIHIKKIQSGTHFVHYQQFDLVMKLIKDFIEY